MLLQAEALFIMIAAIQAVIGADTAAVFIMEILIFGEESFKPKCIFLTLLFLMYYLAIILTFLTRP